MTPLARFLSRRMPPRAAIFCQWLIYALALLAIVVFGGNNAADTLYLDAR